MLESVYQLDRINIISKTKQNMLTSDDLEKQDRNFKILMAVNRKLS